MSTAQTKCTKSRRKWCWQHKADFWRCGDNKIVCESAFETIEIFRGGTWPGWWTQPPNSFVVFFSGINEAWKWWTARVQANEEREQQADAKTE